MVVAVVFIPKTGGTSLRKFLHDAELHTTPSHMPCEPGLVWHWKKKPWVDGRLRDAHEVVAVVRNPWRWLVSIYTSNFKGAHPKKESFTDFAKRWAKCGRNLEAAELIHVHFMFHPFVQLFNKKGRCAAHTLLRTEHLDTHCSYLREHLLLRDRLKRKMLRQNVTQDKRKVLPPDWRDVYCDEAVDALSPRFDPICEALGYSLEGEAPDDIITDTSNLTIDWSKHPRQRLLRWER